jgi:hypothetical protein
MTLASALSKTAPLEGNGATTVFSYGFRITHASHLVVTRTDSFGMEHTLTLNTDYEVLGVGNESGGTITYPLFGSPTVKLPDGEYLTLHRVVPLTQMTDITTGGKFDPRVHEDVFDLVTMGLQQLDERLDRAFLRNISSDPAISGVFPPPKAEFILGWNEEGTALKNYSLPKVHTFLESNLDTSAALTNDIVYYDGANVVFGDDIADLTITGGTVSNSAIVGGTVSGASVIGGTISASAITGATIDNTSIGDTTPDSGTFSSLEVVTGYLTTNQQIVIRGVAPQVLLVETDRVFPVDETFWAMHANNGTLQFAVYDDLLSTDQKWLEVDRNGMAIETVVFPQGDVTISDDLHVAGLITAGTLTTPLTNIDGTIKGTAFDPGIAGAGLAYDSVAGVLSVSGGGGAVDVGDIIASGATHAVIFNNAGASAWGTFDYSSWGTGVLPDANVADNLTISGGTINNSVIGGTTPAAGSFTSVTSTGSITATVQMMVTGSAPQVLMNETDATVDNKYWAMQTDGGQLKFAVFNDALSISQNWLEIDRTGTTIDSITFPQGVLVAGSASTTLTNADGTIKGNAIESAIAGSGLTYTAGVLSAALSEVNGVAGPGPSVTNEAVAVFDGIGGLTIKETGVTVTVAGAVAGVTTLNASGDITTSAGNLVVSAGDLTVEGNSVLNGSVYAGGGTTSSARALVSVKPNSRGELYLRDLAAGHSTGSSTTDGTYLASEDGVFTIAGQNDSGVGTGHFFKVDQTTGEVSVPNGDFEISAGTAHIISGAGSGSPGADALADNLLIEQGHNVGVSLHCPNNRISTYMFGTQSLARAAEVQYDYTGNSLKLRTHRAGAEVSIGADNDIANLVLSGASGSELAKFSGSVHVNDGAAAASVNANANDLVVENNATGGMSILTPNGTNANIYFGSPSSSLYASIQAQYNNNMMSLTTNRSGGTMTLGADATVLNLSLTGAAGSQLATFEGDVKVKGLTIMEQGAMLTVSSNAITITSSTHVVGTTGTPTINTINGASVDGTDLVLLAGFGTPFTIAHNAGNIFTNTAANVTFNSLEVAHLRYITGKWYLINGTNP